MHVSGFLIFLAIVVYWASCMGRRALKWVAILFVSGCLVPVAAVLALWAVETYRAPQQKSEGFKASPEERAWILKEKAYTDALECRLYGDHCQPHMQPAAGDLMQEYLRLEQKQATPADLDAFSARHFPARPAPRP